MAKVAMTYVGITRDDVISIHHQAGLPIDDAVIERWLEDYSRWSSYESLLGYLRLHYVTWPLDARLQKNIKRRGKDIVIARNGG